MNESHAKDPDAPASLSGESTRRSVLVALAALGAGRGAVGATPSNTEAGTESAPEDDAESPATEDAVSPEDVRAAERLLGLELTDAERELMLEDLAELRRSYQRLRSHSLDNDVAPALVFEPVGAEDAPFHRPGGRRWTPTPADDATGDATTDEALHYLPAHRQARLLRDGDVTSVELTRLYLERLERLDPLLHCVIERTGERALEAAAAADAALAAGRDHGPLHGLPWGAKDLLATKGYRTTWGATPFKDQRIDADAGVVRRLDEAGAVLAAKLTLGALAWGDVWFGGKTRNPWNLEQGSSGSSAGSASAVAAGLVSIALGSETLGSIVSPCTRCGTTGLRPTYGLVGRSGSLALSWSMDKLGPIARSVEDCALVLEALAGDDPAGADADPAASGRRFRWHPDLDPTRLRVGVVRSAFEEERDDAEWRLHDKAVLRVLEALGMDLVEIELPSEEDLPIDALSFILSVEASAAFEEFSRSGLDDQLVRQVRYAWPNIFRQARFVPAVEYVQANRVRRLLGEKMQDVMESVDVFVCPSFGASSLLITNLTGHPALVVPNGFRDNGTPTSITFTGRLFGENELVAVARAYQQATDHHLKRPPVD